MRVTPVSLSEGSLTHVDSYACEANEQVLSGGLADLPPGWFIRHSTADSESGLSDGVRPTQWYVNVYGPETEQAHTLYVVLVCAQLPT